MENFEDLKIATPSVFICRDKWICVFLSCVDEPLKNPSSPKCFLYSCPSKISSMASEFCFCLVTRYCRKSGTSGPKKQNKYLKTIQKSEKINFTQRFCLTEANDNISWIHVHVTRLQKKSFSFKSWNFSYYWSRTANVNCQCINKW